MNNKIIVLSTCLFMLASFIFLSWTEKNQADINAKNIWMIYFQDAKNSSLDFVIENHSENKDFHWQVLAETSLLKEADEKLATGETKQIQVSLSPAEITDKKITILVSANNEKKEIYKILP